ncbi:hypothetical protein DACRYDRAFT_112349 [Dacryopinax primogenitus]|uniref:Origin recognition complex subunit 5 C-terminal domain-containing protein n=1 Tax=Dacryopinax primogenitus (strain DJM 731) TaxID=1858805 RepID=M5FUS2_DACPD|nr:uncharacterized protein DACRYDRAFT_112349 [Dacryopinax primogenitus]EJT97021.1 hypothetical protein DACRYDRAFT_112349 [Dacryopinax primogenitus]
MSYKKKTITRSLPHQPSSAKGWSALLDLPTPLLLVLDNPSRLSPSALITLSRAHELTHGRISVLLLSECAWDAYRPVEALQGYTLYLPPLSISETANFLRSLFPSSPPSSSPNTTTTTQPTPYHPTLLPLWTEYTRSLLSTFSPSYSTCPLLLARLAVSRWGWFVSPVLGEWRYLLERERPSSSPEGEAGEKVEKDDGLPFLLSSQDVIKLIRYTFSPSYTHSVHQGLPPPLPSGVPRLRNPADWLNLNLNLNLNVPHPDPAPANGNTNLPRLSEIGRWTLLASYICSSNPARTDLKLFGTQAEQKRKRRRGRATRLRKKKDVKGEGKDRLSGRDLGPSALGTERLLAVLRSLLALHLPPRGKALQRGIGTALMSSTLAELGERRLLVRPLSGGGGVGGEGWRCALRWEGARALGRELGVRVELLLWE